MRTADAGGFDFGTPTIGTTTSPASSSYSITATRPVYRQLFSPRDGTSPKQMSVCGIWCRTMQRLPLAGGYQQQCAAVIAVCLSVYSDSVASCTLHHPSYTAGRSFIMR